MANIASAKVPFSVLEAQTDLSQQSGNDVPPRCRCLPAGVVSGSYDGAAENLERDWDRMVTFYNFPAEH